MATAATTVGLDELRLLFAGVRVPDDQQDLTADPWSTRPCYSPVLAAEIAQRIGATSEGQLRAAVYGTLDISLIDPSATLAITVGYRRHERTSNRGL